jgi:hypothetical protein
MVALRSAYRPQVGATDSATIRAINSERAELAQRVQEVRQQPTGAVAVVDTKCHV